MQTGSSFVHSSPISSLSSHDPLASLSSHTIRDAFGPTVQLIADALESRGSPGTTLQQLITHLKMRCPPPARRLGLPAGEQPTDPESVRAALLVLVRHGIVTAENNLHGKSKRTAASKLYRYHPERARWLLRYAKYIDFMKKAVDETAAIVVQTLLVAGRLRTVDLVVAAAASDSFCAQPTVTETSGLHANNREQHQHQHHHRYTARQQVVETFYKLVTQGFIHVAKQLTDSDENDDAEAEFESDEPPTKKIKFTSTDKNNPSNEDPAVLSLLLGNAHYKSTLPVDSLWCVNIAMFHDYLRAYNIGRLVAERFGSRVQSCGSLVTAALKYRAFLHHVTAPREHLSIGASPQLTSFTANDLIKFLPKPVLHLMEKKVGGLQHNLQKAWEDLSELSLHPIVVRRIGNKSECFELAASSLVDFAQERIVHQIVLDRHGVVAARVISILLKHRWLESEALAEHAMVPAKDIREVLHTLYRSRYVEMNSFSNLRQHNPSHSIYLWGVNKARLRRQASEDITTALWNLRLRRQHEMEIGKDWVERAQQATDTDENDHEMDRLNYQKFCLGLERLDHAALQLDDALMAMIDF